MPAPIFPNSLALRLWELVDWVTDRNHEVRVQNIILALTASVGIWTLRSSAKQERRRATVDIVLDGLSDQSLTASRALIKQLESGEKTVDFFLSEAGDEDRVKIFLIANRYEFIAAGLREKAFDTRMYKRLYKSSVVRDWHRLCPLITAYRDARKPNYEKSFVEFQGLAKRWSRKQRLMGLFVSLRPANRARVLHVTPLAISAVSDDEKKSVAARSKVARTHPSRRRTRAK